MKALVTEAGAFLNRKVLVMALQYSHVYGRLLQNKYDLTGVKTLYEEEKKWKN